MSSRELPQDEASPARRGMRLGYRLKVPLALSAVALLAGIAVALATFVLVDRHFEANAVAQAHRLAATLARSLPQSVLRNDVWQAYQLLKASSIPNEEGGGPPPRLVVIDAAGRIFASLQPREFPVGLGASQLKAPLAAAAKWIQAEDSAELAAFVLEDRASGTRTVAARITGEERTLVGGVILQEELGISHAQRWTVALQLAFLGAIAIAVVAAIGWASGRQLIRPLEVLRDAMREAPTRDVRQDIAGVSRLNDEVGDLGQDFLAMMDELDAKRDVERQMLQAERLASIGRLTAAIAHEVNNPLGGMLAAIGNRHLRGGVDEATARTLSLLERGLDQIHSTVSALLNEARTELHELSEDDIHDLHLLLKPEADHASCGLDWHVSHPAGTRLPSVPVRQVILNLVLNAIAASGPRGNVRVRSRTAGESWEVFVANTGATLDAQRLAQLAEGRAPADRGRSGLGLWVTARILHTLGGSLTVLDGPPDAEFATELKVAFPGRYE